MAESVTSSCTIVGMCNPLLDISAVVPAEMFEKYEMKVGDAALAAEIHMPVYEELVNKYEVNYTAGGAGQNSIRVAQWMLNKHNIKTAYFGAVGDDNYAKQMATQASKDGVEVQYMVTDMPTGTCACLINDNGERSLIANLSAANHFKAPHLEKAECKAIIESSKFYYITGFFLTVSVDSIEVIGKHCVDHHKTLCMNVSAPFIMQFFSDQMLAALPYVDIMFGNEAECEAFGDKMGWGKDLVEIATKISALPKACGLRSRLVIITQGPGDTIVVKNGIVTLYPVPQVSKEELVDVNGAGDAFVGGFLAQLSLKQPIKKCIHAGHWAAREIILRSGCTFPADCAYDA